MYVVSVGEVLWDVMGDHEFLGGAPFNLAVHLTQLGHEASFVSSVGKDARGDLALSRARELGIDTRFLSQTSAAATGISHIVLDNHGIATHDLPRPAAYDFMEISRSGEELLQRHKPAWICFGTLTQMQSRPQAVLTRLLESHPNAGRFYDINLRPKCWTPELVESLLTSATAVKLNQEELDELAKLFGWPGLTIEAFAAQAAARFSLDLVCVTRGSDGCVLWHGGEFTHHRGYSVNVVDTVGSGDAFSAALLHGFSQNWKLAAIAEFANRVGALVASKAGATPVWTEDEAAQLVAAPVV